jgi:septum site-determining protein MinC
MPKNQPAKPIEIKISTVVAVSAILHASDLATLDAAMRDMTGGEPDYFEGEFAVLDIGAADFAAVRAGGKAIDWQAMIAMFKSYRLNPVAVRNAPAELEEEILSHGLSIDVIAPQRAAPVREEIVAPAPAPVAAPAPVPAPVPAPQPAAAAPAAFGSMIIDTPVRGGQRIYARGSDLIVMAAVNPGAEIIADGSIHVYAPLRGRALAGANGNTEARIFAMNMEPELISIAGIYRTFEGGLPKEQAKRPAQIKLVGDKLDIKSITI